jgi:hypothetical protein
MVGGRKLSCRLVASLLMTVLLASCGGDAGSSTSLGSPETTPPPAQTKTTAMATTTSEAVTTTSSAGSTGSTYPAECLEAVRGFVTDIEPTVKDFDFEGGDINAYLDLLTAQVPVLTALAESFIAARCDMSEQLVTPDMADELMAFAEQEAPGTVAFLEIMSGETPERGNDCAAFTDAMQGYVDQGGIFTDLTPAEKYDVANLYAAITNWCSLQTAGEYLSRPEVEGFLGITVG